MPRCVPLGSARPRSNSQTRRTILVPFGGTVPDILALLWTISQGYHPQLFHVREFHGCHPNPCADILYRLGGNIVSRLYNHVIWVGHLSGCSGRGRGSHVSARLLFESASKSCLHPDGAIRHLVWIYDRRAVSRDTTLSVLFVDDWIAQLKSMATSFHQLAEMFVPSICSVAEWEIICKHVRDWGID